MSQAWSWPTPAPNPHIPTGLVGGVLSENTRIHFVGHESLAKVKDSPVVVVSAEQYEAACGALPGFAILAVPAGADVLDVDSNVLNGLDVVLWPDGMDSTELANVLGAVVARKAGKLRLMTGRSPQWFVNNNSQPADVVAWARENAKKWEPIYAAPSLNGEPYEPRPYSVRDEFGDPLDIFSSPKTPTLKPEFIPRSIQEYVFDQAELLGVEPGAVALGCIVGAASAVDDAIKLQPKRHDFGWLESARLWGALVDESAGKKSPALERGFKHLKHLDMKFDDAYKAKMKQYAREITVHAKREKAHILAEVNGTPAGTLSEAPEKPLYKRMIANDLTVEALSVIMQDNPRGILVFRDELSGWIGSFDGYKANGVSMDRSNWLEFYNGGSRRIDRVGRGAVFVKNWGGCILGGIQPSTISRLVRNAPEDGLLQRFMFVCPNKIDYDAQESDHTPNTQAINRWHATLDQLVSIIPGENPALLSDGANEIRLTFDSERKALLRSGLIGQTMQTALGKWDGLFARLCITFHAIECASAKRHPQDVPVSAITAEMVRQILTKFFLQHAYKMYHDILGTSARTQHIRWIGGHIIAHSLNELTNRDVMRGYNLWSDLLEVERREVMTVLEDSGWLKQIHNRRGDVKKWAVNPMVHDVWRERAQQERERRAIDRERCLSLLKGVDRPEKSS